ncbi:hypothetical protein [Haloquadratum walsbyi]|jgi:hypothetical protein|uniref:Uncharacterized protein n=1 Tax=Haloquadratum walsbyi J07HQW2 TaxID=1238425 RepID=U1NG00_9EURY|nr:hypothetical protein [Haloquadratum walsbyi]ERG96030.1 MAG: hypothetical protein J07HQW2_02497 [Haloquadratum walsbyi J07HQW2]
MSLERTRAAAYLCGAFAGSLTTAAIVDIRTRSFRSAIVALIGATVFGAAAVGLEEWTQNQTKNQEPS